MDTRDVILTVVAAVVLVNVLIAVALVSLSGTQRVEADKAADD